VKVAQLLNEQGYSLQSNRKTEEGEDHLSALTLTDGLSITIFDGRRDGEGVGEAMTPVSPPRLWFSASRPCVRVPG